MKNSLCILILLHLIVSALFSQREDHLVFEGEEGPGKGKHVVFLSGDEEYRSEECLPMMAQILAKQGFKCTVLFSIDEATGIVNPMNQASLSHPEALDTADALVMALRFRNWNDETMIRFEKALSRGIPIAALRTSTHAFKFPKDSKWAKYSFNAKPGTGWAKGFGREILGESWAGHHGRHRFEGTRSFIEESNKAHAILKGVGTIFGTTDVYGAKPDMKMATVLLRGQVTKTLESDSPAVEGKKNNPMQPIAWTREYEFSKGKKNRIFTTTMGAATDLSDANLRRLVLNSVYWGLSLPVPGTMDVSLPGVYEPTMYKAGAHRKGLKPKDFICQPLKGETAGWNLKIKEGSRIALLGNGLGSRMLDYGHFETEMHLRYPDHNLFIRNICDDGNTPSFRPHSGRSNQLGFPGGENYHQVYDDGNSANGKGHFETDEQWLERLKIDTVIAFFGFSESFLGEAGTDIYRKELDAFIKHTISKKYDGESNVQLALISPTAYQNITADLDVPNGIKENKNLSVYAQIMEDVAEKNGVLFVDAYTASLKWYGSTSEHLTKDGALLNDAGYRKFSPFIIDGLYGKTDAIEETHRKLVHDAVVEKNWCWTNDFKIPNGVHVFGGRYKPYGPMNYPDELKKIREMTLLRDQAIWSAVKGEKTDLASLDAKTHVLRDVRTNYKPSTKNGSIEMLEGETAASTLKVPKGYKIEQWATETEFPDLANPIQMSFDNQGRLWVAVTPTYPHYRPGDPKPNDKLLILEDTNNDGKADKQTVWADGLHLPIGFEFAPEGVYLSQGLNLVLLQDTDNDGKADKREIILTGFDDHDSHHAISAFCADPSGAFLMGEGVFLRTNVETAYGTVRGTDGGFYRYNPQRRHLERHAQLKIPNPWGIAFDDWGQPFFMYTSGPSVNWMLPGTVSPRYGDSMGGRDLLERAHRVRPMSGMEFLSSSHFPDEVQGDMMLCNVIGFRGIKQHGMLDDGTGYTTKYRQDLVVSEDGNFRPVDLEVAPDGSLYVIDWHNPLIGHMQHNARDPHRDHSHGRIYRITYPDRPLVKPAKIYNAKLPQLLENLKLAEYRSRYRTRREIRGRDSKVVLPAINKWVADLDNTDPGYEHQLLEALWVTWGMNQLNQPLLRKLLQAQDYRVRAAAVNVLKYNGHQVKDQVALLKKAAMDEEGRVRVGAITAASWLDKESGLSILGQVSEENAKDSWTALTYNKAKAHLNGVSFKEPKTAKLKTKLKGEAKKLFMKGAEIYKIDGYCGTCHQDDGAGLDAAGFPPLSKSRWVTGSDERLIKLTLNGLFGPIEVKGKKYPGQVPMTQFHAILKDEEIAAVLTYVRNSFGNKASAILPGKVKAVREATKNKTGFYSPEELLKAHPYKAAAKKNKKKKKSK